MHRMQLFTGCRHEDRQAEKVMVEWCLKRRRYRGSTVARFCKAIGKAERRRNWTLPCLSCHNRWSTTCEAMVRASGCTSVNSSVGCPESSAWENHSNQKLKLVLDASRLKDGAVLSRTSLPKRGGQCVNSKILDSDRVQQRLDSLGKAFEKSGMPAAESAEVLRALSREARKQLAGN